MLTAQAVCHTDHLACVWQLELFLFVKSGCNLFSFHCYFTTSYMLRLCLDSIKVSCDVTFLSLL